MDSSPIVTITINPALDKSAHIHKLIAEQKIRCGKPQYDAGGGGINVSKAIAELGGESLCIFTSGGSPGKMLEHLINKKGIESFVIPTNSWTRENFIAFDDDSKSQYRFGFPGNELTRAEQKSIIDKVKSLKAGYIVISGSLNEGLEPDFYQKIIKAVKKTFEFYEEIKIYRKPDRKDPQGI